MARALEAAAHITIRKQRAQSTRTLGLGVLPLLIQSRIPCLRNGPILTVFSHISYIHQNDPHRPARRAIFQVTLEPLTLTVNPSHLGLPRQRGNSFRLGGGVQPFTEPDFPLDEGLET